MRWYGVIGPAGAMGVAVTREERPAKNPCSIYRPRADSKRLARASMLIPDQRHRIAPVADQGRWALK
jgi:hypothetical protein